MTEQYLPSDTLVVIATGEEAKIFRNTGGANTQIKLQFERDLHPQNLADEGPSGKTPPEMSDEESMEATFSKQLAQFLFTKAHAGEFNNLALAADPDTLGEMRRFLHKEVTDKLVMELTKTLINAPTEDIEKAFTKGA